ncbi:MAG: hypothetical protein ACC656_04460, partial [Candidatus Heimdallarchaeota archaeon]
IESIFSMAESIVLLYGNNEFQQQYLIKELIKLNSEETEYDTMNLDFKLLSTTEEDEAVDVIMNRNCDVVLIDTNLTRGRSPDDFADFAKEMKPLISVIILESHEYASQTLISAINNGTFEFVMPSDNSPSEIMNFVLKGIIRSRTLAEKSEISDELENSRDSFAIAKMKLRENLESFDQEEQPILHGLIITLEMRQIYDRFWEDVEFDKEMISGLVESLKNVGGEMFTEEEKIDGLELGGTTIFVREQLDYLFIYFVKNVTPNTSVVIAKEVDTVTGLFREIIVESSGGIPIAELKPFFDKIAIKAHYSFTEILSELNEEMEDNLDFGLATPNESDEMEPVNNALADQELPSQEIPASQTQDTINIPQIENSEISSNSEDSTEKTTSTSDFNVPHVAEIDQTEVSDKEEPTAVNVTSVPSVRPVPSVPSVAATPKLESSGTFEIKNEVKRVDNLSENAKRLNIPAVPTVTEDKEPEEKKDTNKDSI